MSFDFYRNRVLRNGTTNQEIILNERKRDFIDFLSSTPNRYAVLINDESYSVVIQDVKLGNELDNDNKYMLFEYGLPINAGDYVIWEDEYWLIKFKEKETIKSHQAVKMGKCNHLMKWIDKDGKLITKPSIHYSKTLYTTGVRIERVFEIPNGMVGIHFPLDEDTKKLDRTDTFVFNKTKYEITFYNESEHEGLLVLICSEVLPDSSDDMINEIAGRYKRTGNGYLDRLTGEIVPENPSFPKDDNSENQEPINGDLYYTYSATMPYPNDPDSEIWWNEQATYTIHKFVSGEEVDGQFTFAIEGDKNYVENVETTDNSITLKAIFGKRGLIKVIVTDVETGAIAIEKEIQITGG